MLDRRHLIATLGGLAGGLLRPLESLRGQTPVPSPIPDKCKPSANAVKLDYTPPADQAAGIKAVTNAFEKGVKAKNPALKIDAVLAHLTASYKDVFVQKHGKGDFDGANNPIWIVLIDHAFILGQLTVSLRKDNTLPALKPKDVLRAQAKFAEATSSLTCECYIPSGYELPAPRPKTGATAPPTRRPCDNLPHAQIDEECVLCD